MNLHLAQQWWPSFSLQALGRALQLSVYIYLQMHWSCFCSLVGWISHEGAGLLHCIEGHLDSLQYKHILQNVMEPSVQLLYPDGLIHFQQDHSSIHDFYVFQKWLLLQADVELIWLATASDWYEPHQEYVEWGEEHNSGNLACPPSQKWWWAMDPCVRCVGWGCFISALRSITDWVHDTVNEISGRSTGVLDFLLKRPISENSPFKGWSINSHMWGTSRNRSL